MPRQPPRNQGLLHSTNSRRPPLLSSLSSTNPHHHQRAAIKTQQNAMDDNENITHKSASTTNLQMLGRSELSRGVTKETTLAVSYTHLDVYKRQVYLPWGIYIFMSLLRTFILII